MISRLNLNAKLEKLQEYVRYLKEYQKHPLKELQKDYTLTGAVLHYLQISIECVIDIGEVIISELKLRKPADGREVFKILAENEIIPSEFAERFAPVASFRNILVHEYAEIDLDKVYSHLQNDLKDFDFYVQCIAEFVKTKG
ncbi:MAG: DUF86 domain-containing protein [Candidatus Omnitrophota bacterium]|nr:MAG: DUF86 domain-containing protein [Candidatus Omnitrophota bacterium]